MSDESADRVVKRVGSNPFVLEENEYCCVCKTTEWDSLTWFAIGGDLNDPHLLKFCVCKPCKKDRFIDYLASQFGEALSSDPEHWRRNPDGTWTEINKSAA